MQRNVAPALLVFALLSACNKPPSAPVVEIVPSDPTTLDDLVASFVTQALDPQAKDTVSYTYTWSQDGTQRVDLGGDTVPSDVTTRGELWTVLVVPTDGELEGPAGSASVTIADSAPSATVTITPSAPLASEDLLATATGADVDGDAVSFRWSWTRDGVDAGIDGDTVPASATLHGERWEVTALPFDGELEGEPTSASVVIEDEPPEVISALLSPDPAWTTSAMEVLIETSDPDDDAVTSTCAWSADGLEVFADTSCAAAAGTFAKHQQVQVRVTPNDGYLDGQPLETSVVTILNSPPALAAVALDPTEAREDTALTCLPAGWSDADGDAEGYRYSWLVEGLEVGTGTSLDGASFDRGDEVLCVVTPNDGEDDGSPVSSAALTVANTAPSIASATLSTLSPTAADTLSVTVSGTADLDGDPVLLSYAWYVDGALVATVPAIDGTTFSRGDSIYAVVTPSDGTDTGTPVTTGTAVAVNSPPVASAVSISPSTLYTSSTASAVATTSDADGDTVTLSYAWTVDGAAAGTGASLLGATAFDRGQVVGLTVTPSDGTASGTPVSATSVTVRNSPPTAPAVTITPAEPEAGVDDLVCEVLTPSTDADGDTLTYLMLWTRNGTSYTATAATTWAGDTILASETGESETWVCTVTPSDGTTTGTSATASVDIGGGGSTCTWPEYDLPVSSGPTAGPPFNPYIVGMEAVFVAEDSTLYDWEYDGSTDTAYVEFIFYDSTFSNSCSVLFDLSEAPVASGWTSDSGGTIFEGWEIDPTGGTTTCRPVSAATWGDTDLRNVLANFTWGVGVGELYGLASALEASVTADGEDWAADWEPYVTAGYLYSDIWGEALELSYVWRNEEVCGVISEDSSGDFVALEAPTAGPLPEGFYIASLYYGFYASVLQP
ncbi:MAG: hypothetical protein ABIO70_05265 [Pseudomonadota bacterium]